MELDQFLAENATKIGIQSYDDTATTVFHIEREIYIKWLNESSGWTKENIESHMKVFTGFIGTSMYGFYNMKESEVVKDKPVLFDCKCGYKAVLINTKHAGIYFPGTHCLDDMTLEPITDRNAIYIPVLNFLCSIKSFIKWDNEGKFYSEDVPYQDRNIERYIPSALETYNKNYYPTI